MLNSLKEKLLGTRDKKTSLEKAIGWVKKNRIPGSGVVVHHKTKDVTPEVTGYLIESLYNAGEKDFAFDLARWEASIQRPDGSFVAPGTDVAYTFDTAQVVRGFLAVVAELPEVEKNLRKTCDYLLTQIDPHGEVHTPTYAAWTLQDGTKLSRYCNLYVLPPLLEAGKKYNEPKYIEAAKRSVVYFKRQPDIVQFKPELGTLSHIFGYMMEALVDLGEINLAKKGLAQALALQEKDGYIPAYPGATWMCSTGLAQLGIAWAKIGQRGPAELALKYLEKIQNSSGGFYGGYGKNVQYFPREEISWAVKYFIDLHLLLRGKNV